MVQRRRFEGSEKVIYFEIARDLNTEVFREKGQHRHQYLIVQLVLVEPGPDY